jgi:hypothetical protein
VFPEIVQFVSLGEDPEQETPPPPSAEFPEIVQLLIVGEDPEQETPPPLHPEVESSVPFPPISLKPSSFDPAPSMFSKLTTLARSGFVGVSDIRIVVCSGPASPLTVIALPLNVTGSVITYSPGLTSTVSPSAAASIAG